MPTLVLLLLAQPVSIKPPDRPPTKACVDSKTACASLFNPPAEAPWSCTDSKYRAVVTIGDSIMEGNYSSVGAALASSLGSLYEVRPRARGGSRIDGCVTQSACEPTAPVVVWNCGINNILQGWTAEDAWAEALVVLNGMRTRGSKIVAANLTRCGGYATCNNARNDTFNASLAAWCSLQGNECKLVDMNTLFYEPTNSSLMRISCRVGADFLHPSAACSSEYAGYLADAVKLFYPQ